jgi:biotin carboxyl carrier protein
VDRPVAYRVEVAGRAYDVSVVAQGEALAIELAPAADDPEGQGGAGTANRADAAGPVRSGAVGAGREEWLAEWRPRAAGAYTLGLVPADGSAGSTLREILVAAVEPAADAAGDGGGQAGRAYWVAADGYQEEARVVEARARRLAAALPRRAAGAVRLDVRAPMPGRVVSIRVAVGAVVERGDLLATLEAMKMENELRAPGAGRVQALHAREGDTVEHGALLLVLAPPEAAAAEPTAIDPG